MAPTRSCAAPGRCTCRSRPASRSTWTGSLGRSRRAPAPSSCAPRTIRPVRPQEALLAGGFRCPPPGGAYYILAVFSRLSDRPDDEFARWLTCEAGVAPVPGSSFFSRPELGRNLVRFAFCKTEDQLREAGERLRVVRGAR